MEKLINTIKKQAQYADTDAYGVVWHGTYLRWMEEGRVEWLFDRGVHIGELAEEFGIVLPVVEINVRYKQPVRLMDRAVITTSIKEYTRTSVTFEQIVTLEETGGTCVIADVRATAIDKNRKVVRNMDILVGLKKEN